jgi:glycosyltransferase involved in cell wall biosynthesis
MFVQIKKIDVSIITPSYNMLSYLKCCAASIADQNEVQYEHIVVDAKSSDKTVEWLSTQSNIRYVSEPDNGIYDAINKGLKLAKGSVFAYLNCDEQYLPSTLQYVIDCFNKYPDIDFIYGDTLVVNKIGSIVAFKKAYNIRLQYLHLSALYIQTCSLFFRRNVIDKGILFDTQYQSAGDAYFVEKMLKHGMKGKHIRKYLSTFTLTGNNLCFTDAGRSELREWLKRGFILRLLDIPLALCQFAEKFISGVYWERMPIKYSIYTHDLHVKRKEFVCDNVSFSIRSDKLNRKMVSTILNILVKPFYRNTERGE